MIMKYILLLIFLAIGFGALAQSRGKARIFGFVQPVAPAVAGGSLDISGEEVPTARTGGQNLMLYIAAPSRVYPSEIWVNGEQYSVRSMEVRTSPVRHGSKVLVPRTAQKVWQMIPGPAAAAKSHAKARQLAKTNEMVVVYKQNGKFWYNTLAKVETLEGAARQ